MGNPVLDPETALEFFHIVLYCMACIFAGAAFIGLAIYIVLLCSEIFSRQAPSQAPLANVSRPINSARNLELRAAETSIPAEAKHLGEETGRVEVLPRDAPG